MVVTPGTSTMSVPRSSYARGLSAGSTTLPDADRSSRATGTGSTGAVTTVSYPDSVPVSARAREAVAADSDATASTHHRRPPLLTAHRLIRLRAAPRARWEPQTVGSR